MIKVGDLVKYNNVAFGKRRGIVLKVHMGEVKVQFFPATDQPAYWMSEKNLRVVSGAVYNRE